MDQVTRALRDMYEQYPYPSGGPTLRTSSDVRLLLSYVERSRPAGGPLHALDAGCGRGVGLIGHATAQPDVFFTGIDINRRGLEEAVAEASRRNLGNIRVQEIDLMTLEGLEAPPGGFDVIYSSGVVHHLSDPLAGLKKLAGVLAPHGVMALMVYGRHGREPLYRLVRAIDALIPRDRPIAERLEVGRRLARTVEGDTLAAGPWGDAAKISDVEFVDRYLNVNETSYDIVSLWSLLEAGGFRFLRWSEPRDWSAEALPEGLRERLGQDEAMARYRLIEQVCWRPAFELLVHGVENGPRRKLARDELATAPLAVNPEVTFEIRKRLLRSGERIERLAWQLRNQKAEELSAGPIASAVIELWDQNLPFRGAAMIRLLSQSGMPAVGALEVMEALLEKEILFSPHETEL